MALDRRSFLRSLFVAPAIVRIGALMPVVAPMPSFMRGDLVNFGPGMWQAIGWHMVCEPVRRVERDALVFRRYQYGHDASEVRVPLKFCDLFHGLPGNRVDNPSMRHKLIRHHGFALRYADDPIT